MSQPTLVIPLDAGRDQVEVCLLMKAGGDLEDTHTVFLNGPRDLEELAAWWKDWESKFDPDREHTCELEVYLPERTR